MEQKTFYSWLVQQRKNKRIDGKTGVSRLLRDIFKTEKLKALNPKGVKANDYRNWIDRYQVFSNNKALESSIGDLEEAWYEYIHDITKNYKGN